MIKVFLVIMSAGAGQTEPTSQFIEQPSLKACWSRAQALVAANELGMVGGARYGAGCALVSK